MALIKCSECGSEVSDKAAACPKCGNPISDKKVTKQVVEVKRPKQYGCLHIFLIVGLFAFIYSLWNGESSQPEPDKDMCADNVRATTMIQNYVSTLLSAPSSAKFAYETAISTGNCSFSLKSYVDSQNVFGAMIRKKYGATIKYDKTTDKWNMTSFSFLD